MRLNFIGLVVISVFFTSSVFAMEVKNTSTKQTQSESGHFLSDSEQVFVVREITQSFLKKINEIKNYFRDSIRDDYNNRANDLMPMEVTLDDAMVKHRESSMRITNAQKLRPSVMETIEEIFTFFYGDLPVNFVKASERMCLRVEELQNLSQISFKSTIPFHLKSCHSNFPALEKLIWMFHELDGHPDTLIYSHEQACMNGLNGRICLLVILLLESKLKECGKSQEVCYQYYNNLEIITSIKDEVREYKESFAELKRRQEEEQRLVIENETKRLLKEQEDRLKEEQNRRIADAREGKLDRFFLEINIQVIDDEVATALLIPMSEFITSEDEKRKILLGWGYILRDYATKERLEDEYRIRQKLKEFEGIAQYFQ